MTFLIELSVREMFFYFALTFGVIALFLSALLSPFMLREPTRVLKGRAR